MPIEAITDLVVAVEQSIEAVLWLIARRHAEGSDVEFARATGLPFGRAVQAVPSATARELQTRIERLAAWAQRLDTFEDES